MVKSLLRFHVEQEHCKDLPVEQDDALPVKREGLEQLNLAKKKVEVGQSMKGFAFPFFFGQKTTTLISPLLLTKLLARYT